MSENSGNSPNLPASGPIGELEEDDRMKLAQAGTFKTLSEGKHVAIQGEPHHSLLILISGKIDVSCRNEGDKIPLANLKAGETIGEMSMIDPQKSSADAVVHGGPAEVWTITYSDFDKLVESDPMLGYRILRVLSMELCRRLRHNSDTMLSRLKEKRERFFDMDF